MDLRSGAAGTGSKELVADTVQLESWERHTIEPKQPDSSKP